MTSIVVTQRSHDIASDYILTQLITSWPKVISAALFGGSNHIVKKSSASLLRRHYKSKLISSQPHRYNRYPMGGGSALKDIVQRLKVLIDSFPIAIGIGCASMLTIKKDKPFRPRDAKCYLCSPLLGVDEISKIHSRKSIALPFER